MNIRVGDIVALTIDVEAYVPAHSYFFDVLPDNDNLIPVMDGENPKYEDGDLFFGMKYDLAVNLHPNKVSVLKALQKQGKVNTNGLKKTVVILFYQAMKVGLTTFVLDKRQVLEYAPEGALIHFTEATPAEVVIRSRKEIVFSITATKED